MPSSPRSYPLRRALLVLAAGAISAACTTPVKPPGDNNRGTARSADLVVAALNFLDVDYKWGGNTPAEGFDCSGFTRHVYQTLGGIPLPRTTEEQAGASGFKPVELHDLAPGDLVFFNILRRTYSHVGIYVGDGRFVHAPRTGAQVRVDNLRGSYWASRYTGARRHNYLS